MTDRLSGAEWFKSTYSGADKACVEVAFLADGAVGIRDSKDPTGPALVIDPSAWDLLLDSIVQR
ncbi:DUF397 domain-containing protein [Nocardia zapadnayensis]|uniref:DUF397 domain-containing protein n=1 Tax=Nocardia rhamnosiphila TaxID=426716 RepID=UPI002246D3F6|nr:DUF397 domain-containing protein [Nocardia zapadnayensis]MCX0270222.1 DUF397 domain-containing protein [Nocardia zapadnayensis]